MFSSIAKLIGIAIIIALGVCFVVFVGFWFFTVLFGAVALLAVAWAFGLPITISRNGHKIGYVRWFTFYRNFY